MTCKCNYECETCNGVSRLCSYCKFSWYLDDTNICIKNCQPKFYNDIINRICEKCSENCEICLNEQICSVC